MWSRWFRGKSRPSTDASTPPRSITVGEVVGRTEHPSSYVPGQRCLLCEASAPVAIGESEVQIECAACGKYGASFDAARALDGLVQYREPALAEMRKMLAASRQSAPARMPRIAVQYVVAEGVPTFSFISD
jgi:hypothetical protein